MTAAEPFVPAYANWRPQKRITDPKVFKSESADEMRGLPCASCRSRAGVTLHHVVPRSQRGDDLIANLIGLCVQCHDDVHHSHLAWGICHAIGRKLTPANIAYVIGKKGAGWLEDRYGVIA